MNKYLKQYILEEINYFDKSKKDLTKKYFLVDNEIAEKIIKMIILEKDETIDNLASLMGVKKGSLYNLLNKNRWSKEFYHQFINVIKEFLK